MQRFFIIAFAMILAMILLISCSMPGTKIYSLAVPEEKTVSGSQTDASVNLTVHSPRYLGQSYIAYRNSPYQIEMSRYSRWDMPPVDLVRDAFRETLSAAGLFREVKASVVTPGGYYNLDINLKRFERLDEGETSFCQLLFEVKLRSPEGNEVYKETISKTVRLEDRGFPNLAKVLSSALAEGIGQIQAGIAKAITGTK
ncbi:MAG: ABC-type transport auxiliary lipoprotein family protein [Thermodesulfovibrionales bacterium]